jgi:two-component system nitrate/nitrite response regulator NarL
VVTAVLSWDDGVMRPTLLLVDDHSGFRSLAHRLLEAGGFDVVGEAATGQAAVASVRELRPDVVLLDIQLPDIDGFEVTARLADGEAAPVVVLTSTRDRADYGERVERCGARGFIPKAELSGAALRALLGGDQMG